MALDVLINYTQLYLLVLARVFALLRTAPMTSSANVPSMVRVGLTLFCSVAVLPGVIEAGYPIPPTGFGYAALVIGEAMVGVVLGFFLNIVFAAFLSAGQFFSLQMGFGASQVYDPLAQVEIPVMGQFMNIIAMLVFVTTGGFQKIFLYGVDGSFRVLRAVDLVAQHDYVIRTLLSGLSRMFEQALIISFPIFGTLILVYVAMGLLAKAAPQMNLLMLGFPIAIGVAFVLLVLTVPLLMDVFAKIIDASFEGVLELAARAGGGS